MHLLIFFISVRSYIYISPVYMCVSVMRDESLDRSKSIIITLNSASSLMIFRPNLQISLVLEMNSKYSK